VKNFSPEQPAATDWSGWETWVQARIADALVEERRTLIETLVAIVGDALGQSLSRERKHHRRDLEAEVRQLRIELCNLESTLAELRTVLAADKAKVIELPNFRRVN
jgi:hypothetical protein